MIEGVYNQLFKGNDGLYELEKSISIFSKEKKKDIGQVASPKVRFKVKEF